MTGREQVGLTLDRQQGQHAQRMVDRPLSDMGGEVCRMLGGEE